MKEIGPQQPEPRPAKPGDPFVLHGVGFCAVQYIVNGKVFFSSEGGSGFGWLPEELAAAAVDTFVRAQPS